MSRVTLKDIARDVGVSVMTVSNVVNGNAGKVSATTAARVRAAIAERGYVPNGAAQSLAARRTRLVGLLMPSLPDDVSLLVSPHDVAVAGAIEATLRRSDHHLMLRGVTTARDVLDSVHRWSLDGIVAMGFSDDELAELELPTDVPTVVIDGYVDEPHRGFVRSDDFEGGRLAGTHLAGLGHRQIVLCGPTDTRSRVVSERGRGLRTALESYPGAADPVELAALTTYESGLLTGERIARTYPQATAVFATADILAVGLCQGLARAGVRVPQDVSVVGYDDLDMARFVTPALTTIAQDTARKGESAAQMLLATMAGDDPHRSVQVPVDLVVRGSSGPARA